MGILLSCGVSRPLWIFSWSRASPVVCDGLVYIHGVTAWLSCLEVKTGKLVWRRDLAREYDVPRYFFGKGSNLIVSGNVLVLNLEAVGNVWQDLTAPPERRWF